MVRRALTSLVGSFSLMGVLVVVALGVLACSAFAAGDANEASCPNEASTGFRASLPDCRAYEFLTPSLKGGRRAAPPTIKNVHH